jgi:hypothetical protein
MEDPSSPSWDIQSDVFEPTLLGPDERVRRAEQLLREDWTDESATNDLGINPRVCRYPFDLEESIEGR